MKTPSRLLSVFSPALAVAIVALAGCAAPPEPYELGVAQEQSQALARAGAAIYAPGSFSAYLESLSRAELAVKSETQRFFWIRDYDKGTEELRSVIAMGDGLEAEIRMAMQGRAEGLHMRAREIYGRIARYREISGSIAGLGGMRKHLVQAETLTDEAGAWVERDDFRRAEELLGEAEGLLIRATDALRSTMGRYVDAAQIAKWQGMKEKAIGLSLRQAEQSILIEKLERRLTLYRGGRPVRTYRIGLGRKGFYDKLHAGDLATPEGHYHVVKKKPDSKYRKALLINYPNGEDMDRYRTARRNGRMAPSTGIGGLVEIHGGGSTSLTDGCISMDDPAIDELYAMVALKTPVTILGTTDSENILHELLGKEAQ